MSIAGVIVSLCCAGLVFASKDLPEGTPKCIRNDPELENCLLKASEAMRPELVKGIPSLGVPSIEPLTIPEIRLEQGTQALNFKAHATDVIVKGLSGYKFSSMKMNFEDGTFLSKGDIGQLDLEGDIKIDGKILVAPITGTGKFSATVAKTTVDVSQKFEIIQKKGVDYMNYLSSTIKVDLSTPLIHFNGLFGNDNELGQATNKLIDENADVLMQDLKPALEEVINELVSTLIYRNIQEKIPFDKLFPVA